MADILKEIDAALGKGATLDAALAALSGAKAEIIALRSANSDLEKKAEAAGAASTAGPSLDDIRKMVRQELGAEPREDSAEEKRK